MYDLVCPHRDDVFLDQHFNAVGDWLKKAERPDAIRAVAVLYPCENFSLQHREQREKRQEYSEQRQDINQARHHLSCPVRPPCQPRKQPVLCVHENLIDGLNHPG